MLSALRQLSMGGDATPEKSIYLDCRPGEKEEDNQICVAFVQQLHGILTASQKADAVERPYMEQFLSHAI